MPTSSYSSAPLKLPIVTSKLVGVVFFFQASLLWNNRYFLQCFIVLITWSSMSITDLANVIAFFKIYIYIYICMYIYIDWGKWIILTVYMLHFATHWMKGVRIWIISAMHFSVNRCMHFNYGKLYKKNLLTGRLLSSDDCEILSTNMIHYESIILSLLPHDCVIEWSPNSL